MARILLIHGAWGDATGWGRIVPRLTAAGHSVEAIDLPGHGRSCVPPETVGQPDYVAHVEQRLLAGPPAMLVAHSMGGIVAAQVASRCPDHVTSCVFVAALLPRDGDSLLGLIRQQDTDGIQGSIRPGPKPGTTELDPDTAAETLFQDADPVTARKALAAMGPQSNRAQKDPAIVGPGFASVPRAYVFCEADRVVTPALQRKMVAATPCDVTFSLSSGHVPQLTQPEALTEVLLGLATA